MRSRLLGPWPSTRSWSPSKSASGFAAHHPYWSGYVAGIIAVLRVDPTEASMIFRLRRLGDGGWTVTFGTAQGLLTYWVVQAEQLVVLLDLTWAG
jgi:hypothetical protein